MKTATTGLWHHLKYANVYVTEIQNFFRIILFIMRLHTRLEEFGVPVQPRAKLNVTHKSEMGCDRAR